MEMDNFKLRGRVYAKGHARDADCRAIHDRIEYCSTATCIQLSDNRKVLKIGETVFRYSARNSHAWPSDFDILALSDRD